MSREPLVRVEGQVKSPTTFDRATLAALSGQVDDVGRLVAGRQGKAVRLSSLLTAAGPLPHATHLTVATADESFAASVPLDAVQQAVVVYELDGAPLPASYGGPVRFLIPDAATCQSGDVDECANVKFVAVLRLTAGPGKDTRPATPAAHAELHEDAE